MIEEFSEGSTNKQRRILKGKILRKIHLKKKGGNKTEKVLYRKDDMERRSKIGL
jgi:hypothetical protein